MGSAVRVLEFLDDKYDYFYLNGISAAAFRFQYADSCPSSPDSTLGFRCDELLWSHLGYQIHRIEGLGAQAPDAVREPQIRLSIDKKRPVIALYLVSAPEWGIITGYQNRGNELFCRTYFDPPTDDYNMADFYPWSVVIFEEKLNKINELDAVKAAIRTAFFLAKMPKREIYELGFAAFDSWIKQLESKEEYDKLVSDAGKYRDVCLGNAWIYERLHHDRAQAIKFLEKIKDLLPENAEALTALAATYRQEVDLLKKNQKLAPYPFTMTDVTKEWTFDLRKQAAAVIKSAYELEKKANRQLEQIVATFGEPPDPGKFK